MAVVVFDSTAFKARYPEFNEVIVPSLQGCFDEATLYLNNTDCSPVSNVTRRAVLLNMLTAHIATLSGFLTMDKKPLAVGRVSDATEGSVSASLDYGPPSGSQAWFAQTQYGAAYFQATLPFRLMRYIPRPARY